MRRLAVVLSGLLATGLAVAATADRKLATVDGQPVTGAALERAAAAGLGERGTLMLQSPVLRRQFLDRVIESRLLAKGATAAGVDRTPAYQELLDEAKTQILANLYARQVVAERTTEPRLRAYFAKDPKRFSAREVRATQLLYKTEAEARRALAEAKRPGADFDELVKRETARSQDVHGGDLGYFRRGRMLPEFDAVAFRTPKGTLAPDVVKSGFGWHVVKVTDARGEDSARYEDVKDLVKAAAEAEAREDLLRDLKSGAKVVVDEDAVRTMAPTH